MNNVKSKKKIFLNSMESWFSNFIIEYFRTDHMPESKNQTEFMCTINSSQEQENFHIPLHFEPSIYKFDFNPSYKTELFSNDIFIYDLNTGNLKEIEYIIKGLKTLRIESEKILILISNIMTWAKTPNKIKTDSEDEVVFIHPIKEDKKEEKNKENKDDSLRKENSFLSNLKEQSFSNSLMGGMNQSKLSIKQLQNKSKLSAIKEEKEENKIIVYYTEKDYLKRKPSLKYFEFKYIENEAINLNQKANIKSYIICPGVIYGYGEKLFYSIFRNALLGKPIEEVLLDKGRNIIPTIHMKDLVNIIAKVIEKKPLSNYILAFDQNKNCSLRNIIRMIYNCIGDEKNMIEKKQINEDNNNKEENNENNDNKEIIVKEEKEENEKKEENEEGKLNGENTNEKNEENNNNNQNNNNKPIVHPFFSNKKYQLSEYFPRELLYLDVKILPSEFLKGETKESKNKEKITIPLFKWHCPSGIISNPDSVKKEFLTYRNLTSNKIFILGNPYTGKTTISQILSKIFHLPIITSKSIADFGKQFANIKLKSDSNEEENKENQNEEKNKENNEDQDKNKIKENPEEEDLFIKRKTSEENDLISEIQKEFNDLEKNIVEAEEAYNKRPNKKKTDPPFDNNMYYRFSDELMTKILKQRLLQNDSSIYGYILDGFPKNYSQLKSLFNKEEKKIDFPNSIILFEDMEDDACINRLKNSEEVLKDPKDPKVNIILERANRRLNKIKEDKSKEDYKSLKDFFDEEENNKIFKDKLMIIDGKDKTVLDIIKMTQEFIKKNNDNMINKIDEELECEDYKYDYVKIEEEKNKQNEEEEKEKEKENINENNNDNVNNNNLEEKEKENENKTINEKEEPKIEETNINNIKEKEEKEDIEEQKEEEKPKPKSKLELEKENEFKLLEKKSEVLRRYLAENVLPLLSLGILHVANERPPDPVEALADYLLAKTFEIKKNEEENNDNEEKEDENINLDIKEDKKEENIEIMSEEKKEENTERKMSPIERENSEKEIKESKESKDKDSKESKDSNEDELNRGMIESNE